jgi:putative flippase GtrA
MSTATDGKAEQTERVSGAEALLIVGMWALAITVAYGNLAKDMGYEHAKYWPSVVIAVVAGLVTMFVIDRD